MAKVDFIPTPAAPPPPNLFTGGTVAEGSSLNTPNVGVIVVTVPIPAGVNVAFGIDFDLMAASSVGEPNSLQRFTHTVVRDGGGVLTVASGFGSGNGMNRLSGMGDGADTPAFAGAIVNANDIEYSFSNDFGGPVDAYWSARITAAKALTP